MIATISQKLANYLIHYTEQKSEVDYLRYGLEIIISGFIKVMLLFLVALFLGVTASTLIAFTTFALFRILTGGYHYSTYFRCLIAGLFLFIGISISISILEPSTLQHTTSYLLFFSLIVGLIMTYKYAPSNHFYRITTDILNKKLRIIAYIAIVIWYVILQLLLVSQYPMPYILASIFAFLFQFSSLHPYSYRFVHMVEEMIDRRKTSEKST
ncbi:accessory gene regulator ArgB-like protein [Bacillus sp. B1-b2]|uniref:accessory gene regulator ArgB-like protein n=1 Tax=Bacillus sp. B1-b2 TaxID=2653201 RepID=UPI001261843E|nr:accessory gene regulator B family protein [Bacillus sp. B1-b2]KAB7670742.1 accessory gene regulator B family protein [Bacillus sp. B1-b2]